MIEKINQTFILNTEEQQLLDSHLPFQPGVWDNRNLKVIKDVIHDQLLIIQKNKCAYCGLIVNETGRAELDHIAKKGGIKRPAYVEFTFTNYNLVISCQYCNSSSKKGQEDVLSSIDINAYHNCTFKIVHPYFDNPQHHYQWSKGEFEILISSITNKGKYSINLFDLASVAHTQARAKEAMYTKRIRQYHNRNYIKQRVLDILLFRI